MGRENPDPKTVDALAVWLEQVEVAPKALEKELTKLIEFLVSEKDKFLPKLNSSKQDQEFFDNELEIINSLRHKLRLLDETIADAFLKAEIWSAVVTIFVAGINLGQYSNPSGTVKDDLQSQKSRDMGNANKSEN